MQRALASVLADPWADRPREFYAETEEDAARADFIRAQLAVARARREAGVRRPEIERQALAASLPGLAHADRWSGGIAPLLVYRGQGPAPWRFRRGFVEEVTLPAAHFLRVAPALYARAPILDLRLLDVKPVFSLLCASPQLERIRSLDLSAAGLDDDDVDRLADSHHLGRLRWLSLYFNGVTDRGVERLAAARAHLPHLRFVRLDGNPCGDPNPLVDELDGFVRSEVELELRERHGAVPWLGDNPSADPPDPEAIE